MTPDRPSPLTLKPETPSVLSAASLLSGSKLRRPCDCFHCSVSERKLTFRGILLSLVVTLAWKCNNPLPLKEKQ